MPLIPINKVIMMYIFRLMFSRCRIRIFVHDFYVVLIVVGSSKIDITVLKITILNNQILDHQLLLALLFLDAGIIWAHLLFLVVAMRRTGSLCSALIPKAVCIPWHILVRILNFFPRCHILLAISTSSTSLLNFGLLFSFL